MGIDIVGCPSTYSALTVVCFESFEFMRFFDARRAVFAGALGFVCLCSPIATMAATATVLHSFTGGADGGLVFAGLVPDKGGDLYGTAWGGGLTAANCNSLGCGTVFKVDPVNGSFKVLYSFAGGADGGNPSAALIVGPGGALYATTQRGGTAGFGTVFEVSLSGQEKVLYSFQGGSADGVDPEGPLILKGGSLYGLTAGGGTDAAGTIFRLTPSGTKGDPAWSETVLHSFRGKPDGAYPNYGGLTLDDAGNLYGTTAAGGATNDGTIFKLGKDGRESVLCGLLGKVRGAPLGGLVIDGSGNLYGTSFSPGTVFKATPDGTLSTLHRFGGAGDGAFPEGSLVINSAGRFFGTTSAGGSMNGGTVFELQPDGKETILYSFSFNGALSSQPIAGLVLDKGGKLFGTTLTGGASAKGTVFVVSQ
jgi:uncharacterized repeat protein (TIGR03803 family)